MTTAGRSSAGAGSTISTTPTTWRNQFVFDDRNISQPTGATSAIGDFPSYNFMSDVTRRGEILGMESRPISAASTTRCAVRATPAT